MFVPNKEPGPHFFLIPLCKYKGKVPFIITDIFKQLLKLNSQLSEGILRKKGKEDLITNLCKELDNGRVNDWTHYESEVIECAFKKYLTNLSIFDPLIPENIEEEIVLAAEQIPEDQIGQHYHDFILNNYSNLLSHRSTLATIFYFFNKVILPNVDKNLMNSSNLATCSYMLFYQPKSVEQISNKDVIEKYMKPIRIFTDKFDQIFEKSWYDPASNFEMTNAEVECLGAPFVNIELAQIEYQRRNYRKNSLIPYYVQESIDPPKREAPKLPDSY